MMKTINSEELQRAIKTLTERDVGFYTSHPVMSGSRTIHLDAGQLLDYAVDPTAYMAKHYGVTREEYLGWHQAEYIVRCAATTSTGKRCKNIAVGCNGVEPKDWVEKQGSYCSVHS